jgi:CHASE2 domain-containing sensor protein
MKNLLLLVLGILMIILSVVSFISTQRGWIDIVVLVFAVSCASTISIINYIFLKENVRQWSKQRKRK